MDKYHEHCYIHGPKKDKHAFQNQSRTTCRGSSVCMYTQPIGFMAEEREFGTQQSQTRSGYKRKFRVPAITTERRWKSCSGCCYSAARECVPFLKELQHVVFFRNSPRKSHGIMENLHDLWRVTSHSFV